MDANNKGFHRFTKDVLLSKTEIEKVIQEIKKVSRTPESKEAKPAKTDLFFKTI